MSANDNLVPSTLTRETILRGLHTLSEELGKQGVTGEACLFGGTVMVLAFNARLATKDVDALFQPAQKIRELAGALLTNNNCHLTGSTTASKVSLRLNTKQPLEICRNFRTCD